MTTAEDRIAQVIATHEPADSYKYMLLDRLRTDCDYFLGYGGRNAAGLWSHSVGTHINCMLMIYDSFPDADRPEWITREQILEYGQRMKEPTGEAGQAIAPDSCR